MARPCAITLPIPPRPAPGKAAARIATFEFIEGFYNPRLFSP
jgi:hypothetical protein